MQNNTLRTFHADVRRAGITPNGSLSIHTLRKSCVLNWAKVSRNPKVTQALAGHADIKTTMRYYSLVDDDQRSASVDAINEMLKATDAKLTPEA